ncbi:DsbA family protein [uncultured Microscilla sp.]|uniref:DsbA family protein n=1 Tax=uncultured Microscilla sp. TaxID=432653 RepID=UPI0026232337|nr:DsbA family protein [uncultured Microscilla sp.]
MKKPQVMYIFDPLCGWCYGFSPVIKQLKDAYSQEFDFRAYLGGMVLGDRAGTINEKFTFLKEGAIERVEQATGVNFGDAFKTEMLDKGDYVINSEPPSIALTILREPNPNQHIEIAHDVQNALYQNGQNLNDLATFLPLADKYGVARDEFTQKFTDEAYRKQTYAEFQMVHQLGIKGYPSVVVIVGEQGYLIGRGYQPYEQISETLKKIKEDKLP